MTDKEKLEKIKSLADKMADTAFNMTTDASLLRKAMDEYHQFIINEYHKEEPVSEELEEASKEWLIPQLDKSYAAYGETKQMELTHFDGYAMLDAIEFGAKWQAEQFEKNRLAACDAQTEEEAEIEQSFVMGIIECEHRQPTFDDAIKYGMRLQKEQIKEALLSEVLPYFMLGGEADEVVAKLDEVINQKK